MGILNITPDSFYDRGRFQRFDRAIEWGRQMVAEGAGIIDVGGEKAGLGEPVSVDEEIARVVPVIEALRGEVDVPISVDTFKPEVARAAVGAGAGIINSIGGFGDPAMRRAAAETGTAVVIMHLQGRPRVANPYPHYEDVVDEVKAFLEERIADCLADGIAPDRIIIDPGPGFGKTAQHDLALLRRLDVLTALPYPVLLAVSRKRFIGEVLGLDVEDRLEGSLAVTAWGVMKGVRIVRTHDVAVTARVCRMIEALVSPVAVEA